MRTLSKSLTKRQQEILSFIEERIQHNGAPPTRAEIADYFGFKSANAAEDHLKSLAKKGYINIKSATSRGITLAAGSSLANTQKPKGFPLVGNVAAGQPILAEENLQQYIDIESSFFNETPDFLLTVRGDSMQNAGIYEGDIIAVRKTSNIRNNQIVVARIEDDVTVKRYQQDGSIITLLPENDDYEPIKVDLSDKNLAIEGIVVGLLRHKLA